MLKDEPSRAPSLRAIVPLGVLLAQVVLPGGAWPHLPLDQQLRRLGELIEREPRNVELRLRRSDLLSRRGRWDSAMHDLALARRLRPDLARVDLQLGLICFRRGDLAQAQRALTSFVARDGSHAEAWATLARIAWRGGRRQAAIASFSRAIDRGSSVDTVLALGSLQRESRQLAEAERTYERGLRDHAGAVVIRLALIELQLGRGAYQRALASIAPMLRQPAGTALWRVRRAAVLERAGRRDSARAELELAAGEARTAFERRRTGLNKLQQACVELARGNREQGLKDYRELRRRHPGVIGAAELNRVTRRRGDRFACAWPRVEIVQP
jgi:tetratricopeptide (TPR) repeat protein